MKKLAVLALTTFALITTACSSKFTEADVQRIEGEIKTQFEQKGLVVEQVSMVKDSDRHMTGFAKVHKADGLFSKIEVTRNCTATMDTDSGKSIWDCK
jgi:protein involved in sex pheromone biosynthesis